jgi:cytochrome b6-f complex iron-sulfur subunit
MSEEKVTPPASVGSSKENPFVKPEQNRRSFLSWLSVGWIAYIGVTGGFFTVIIRFLFPNVLFEPPQTFKIGFPDDYSANSVDIKFKKQFNAWVVRDEESIFALSTVCTHLGCTPNWLPAESKFKCPCHGSGFRMTGIHFEGPAPRPLERFKISLATDGQILVDKTKSFKWEKGEWENPESFLKV